jgi:Uncharacterized protein conserved in bacteria
MHRLTPLPSPPQIDAGFWGHRLSVNREVTIPHGFEQLERAGNFHNLRLAAGAMNGEYRWFGMASDGPLPFLDSDVYKWLEAVAWELGRDPEPALARSADELISLVEAAQRDDGYLNTYVQVLGGGRAYRDLRWGHELYTIGHLVQAAVAWVRAAGDERLLRVAKRAVASIERELGAGQRDGIDGHPEIEMALVELYRTTGEAGHLQLARRLIDARGRGLLGADRFGPEYWQDHKPVREAPNVAGHAVRQLYLDCGAVDVAVEMGDAALLDAVVGRWDDMLATRSYVTGGLGSRHKDESFGVPFELPPDRAYAETCASIASVMLAWRLLLATGRADCADVIERTMFNGVMPGISLDGRAFFYVNTLHRRDGSLPAGPGDGMRAAWFPCACCPPNLMRTFSSWEQYLATTDGAGLQLHQYASAQVQADVGGGRVRLAVETDYPWDGRVEIRILEAHGMPWTLSLRVPGWCRGGTAAVNGEAGRDFSGASPVEERRTWRAGDRVVIELAMPPRVTEPDRRVDAVRSCVAIERGPLVYCVEEVDQPAGTLLDQVELTPPVRPGAVDRPEIGTGMVGLSVPALQHEVERAAWPYRDATSNDELGQEREPSSERLDLAAIPYFAWANRATGAMRVWLPRTPDVVNGEDLADPNVMDGNPR